MARSRNWFRDKDPTNAGQPHDAILDVARPRLITTDQRPVQQYDGGDADRGRGVDERLGPHRRRGAE